MMRAPSLALALLLPAAALAQGAAAPPQAPPAQPAPAQPARPVLGLDEVVRTALQNAPQILQAQANRDVASAQSEASRAPLLPQLKADAFADWATANSAPRQVVNPFSGQLVTTGGGTSWHATRSVGADAVLSQVLFDAAQVQRYRASRANVSSAEATERVTQLQIATGARAAFFAARAARDLVAVQRDNLANQEAHLRQVQAFVQVGTRPEIDLASARAARANARVQLISAENGYDTARAQLLQAMGVVRSTDFDVGDDVLPPVRGEEQPLEPLYAEALAARPEMTSFEQAVRAQELTRSAANAGYLPTVGAQGTVSATGPGPADTYPNWSAGVTLTWYLFQGGATRAAVRLADANLRNLSAQEEQSRQQIRLEVEQARLAVRASTATLASATEAELAAKEQLRLAEGRYRAGAGSIIELGDAQVTAATAAGQRVQSEYNLAASRAQLLRSLGRLNP